MSIHLTQTTRNTAAATAAAAAGCGLCDKVVVVVGIAVVGITIMAIITIAIITIPTTSELHQQLSCRECGRGDGGGSIHPICCNIVCDCFFAGREMECMYNNHRRNNVVFL
jgi:hypothetical protein